MHRLRIFFLLLSLLFAAQGARAEGKLGVFDAWIRAAPPGATMMAGYATLKNNGDTPITVLTVQSDAFRLATLHETIIDKDVSKMREIHRLVVPAGGTLELAPGGKHLMLMQPRHDIAAGDKVGMTFLLATGERVEAYFDVVASKSGGD